MVTDLCACHVEIPVTCAAPAATRLSPLLCRSLRVSAVAVDAGKDSDGALEDPLFGMRPGAPPLRVGASSQVRF